MARTRRRWSRPLAVLLLALGAVLSQAGPAAAHAELTSATPTDGARLATSPAAVRLTFDEAVEVVQGGVRVLDESGSSMPTGAARHPTGHPEQVESPLTQPLSPGTFVVEWRVLSDDGHPVEGSLAFTVGGVTRALPGAPGIRASARDMTASMLVARFVVLTGLTALVGGLGFLWLCWPAGWVDPRSRRVLVSAALATAAGSAALLLLQGAYGHGLGAVVRLGATGATLGTRAGALGVVRVLVALAVAALLTWAPTGRRWPGWAARCGAVVLALTTAASGHAGDGPDRVFAVTVDAVHLGAAALWLGGLLMLLVGPLSVRGSAQSRPSFTRYSRLAATCVVLLVGTGVVAAVRRTGSLGALTGTSYGGVLIVKTALLVTILTFAAGARQVVNHRLAAPGAAPQGPPAARSPRGGVGTLQRAESRGTATARRQPVDGGDLRRLRQSVVVELALGVVVLVATAWLVGLPPARSAYVPTSSTGTSVGSLTGGADSTK